MRVLAALALLATALAGCSHDDPPAAATPTGPTAPTAVPDVQRIQDFEDPSHPCVAREDPDRQHAPDLEGQPWELGQYWTYGLHVGPMPVVDLVGANRTTLVYYDLQDGGRHYMVGSLTREEALHHALHSNNPMLGRIHEALYSPHEGGEHADMFHFPLCDGLQWETLFYGETFALTARAANLAVPGLGPVAGWEISGTSREGSTLRHTYSLEAGWFTELELVRPDGTGVAMVLEETGKGKTGPAFFLRGQQDAVVDLGAAIPAVNVTTIVRADGDDGPYDTIAFDLSLERLSGQGHAEVRLLDPANQEVARAAVGDVEGDDSAHVRMEVPYQAGNWTVLRAAVLPSALPAGGLDLAGELRMVSIYDRSGEV